MDPKWNNEEEAGAYLEFVQCPKCGHAGAYFAASTFTNSEFFDADEHSDVTYTFVCANKTCAHEWKES